MVCRQIWQRTTGRCVTVTGKRLEAEFFIALYYARPIEPVIARRRGTRVTRQMRMGRQRGGSTAAREEIISLRPGGGTWAALPTDRGAAP